MGSGDGRQRPRRIVVHGPLAGFADGLRRELAGQGYALDTVRDHVHLLADLSGWLGGQDFTAEDLSTQKVDEFLRDRRRRECRIGLSPRAIAPILGYLRDVRAQTGLRVCELTRLTINDLHLSTGAHVYCHGKGRKDRCTPLTVHTAEILTEWLAERHTPGTAPLFCTRSGTPMSSDAVSRLTGKYAHIAASACPSITAKKITPHTLRHTAAMTLLHAGVDITVIALWLGHESPATTRIYLHADMALKENAIARTSPPDTKTLRYKAPDNLLTFLDQL